MKKTIFTILSVICLFYVFALAGGSDTGTVTVGQAFVGGLLGLIGCIGFGTLAGREMER